MKPDLQDNHGLSNRALQAALKASRARASELGSEIAAKVREMEEAQSESHLLEQLLMVRAGESAEGEADSSPSGSAARGPQPHPVVLEAMRELAAAGHSLHISELMDRLQARDVPIPGAGRQANLIAHLTRADEIVRPSRGMYALASWDLPEAVKPATRRRVRGPSKAGL